MEVVGGTTKSHFSFAIPNPTAGRIFCSPEQSKLCFEALETRFVPQNHLPLQGLGKHPPKSGFSLINGFRYGRQQKKPNKQRWAQA